MSFYDVIRYEVMKPNRAEIGTDKMFMPILTSSSQSQYEPPDNFFNLKTNGSPSIPPFVVSGAGYTSSERNGGVEFNAYGKKFNSTARRRVLAPEGFVDEVGSDYIPAYDSSSDMESTYLGGGREYLAIPYLPYFSDCNFYGSNIFLYSVIEDNPNCKLVKEEEVKPIVKLKFGMTPVADTCEEVVLQCRYTEDVQNIGSEQKYWFNSDQGTTLFSFLENPISYSEYLDSLEGRLIVSPELYVAVTVSSLNQPGKIPTSIVLDLNYYQIDKKNKKLISAAVNFSGFVLTSEYNNTGVFNYTLKINYRPLTHTELTISFTLPWYVYFSMYLLVGLLSIAMTVIFTLYHKWVSRRKNTEIYFFPYFKAYLVAPLQGLLLLMVPIGIYTVIIGVFFTFHLMNFYFTSIWCNDQDTQCLNQLFWHNLSLEDRPLTTPELIARQNKRLGYVFVHTGIWVLWRSSCLMTLSRRSVDNTKNSDVSYDNNGWYQIAWQRLNYLLLNVLTVILEVFFIHISFSEIFSNNLWYFIAGFKVLGVIIENVAELLLKNGVMLGPISTTIELMENLVTFGAPNFLEFVGSFILGLGVQLAERAYITPIIEKTVDYIKDNFERFTSTIYIMFGSEKLEDDDDEDDQKAAGEDDGNNYMAREDNKDAVENKEKAKEEKAENNNNMDEENRPRTPQDSQASDILLTENSAENEFFDMASQRSDDDNINFDEIVKNNEKYLIILI